MRSFLIVCGIAVFGGGVLAACPIRSRVVVTTPVVKKVVAVVEPVSYYQPLAIAIPTYTAAYVAPVVPAAVPTAPAPAGASGANSADLKAIVDILKSLDQRLKALEQGGKPATTPSPPKPKDPFNPGNKAQDVKGSVTISRCAVCHDAKVSQKLGKGITLWTDGKWTASDKLRIKALSEIRRNTMPPEKNSLGIKQLSDEEANQASEEISK